MQHLPSSIPHINRFRSHLNTAVSIVEQYKGAVPFVHFIKKYYSAHKKFGSRDRREITALCYCFFRLGRSYPWLSAEQKMIKGYQLSKDVWPAEWTDLFAACNLPQEAPGDIFPFKSDISTGINRTAFEQSHLIQPDLFLRIRPGYEQAVTAKLRSANIDFEIAGKTVRLPNSTPTGDIITVNKEAVIQDLNSQKVGMLLEKNRSQILNPGQAISVWDCCAASGGKSILVKDIFPHIILTVSDIRPSIIFNLKTRFTAAGINNYTAFVADAATASPRKRFDLIIADVPCSGSGTWARTPEQLSFFKENQVDDYAGLQSTIVTNTIRYLKPGGYLLYITCSVFKKENEQRVSELQAKGMQLVQQEVLTGYSNKADTMFAALLRLC
ncbi:MAG TPA: methyltransferase domain-containing protein [Niabella sp.]|nr:methyltransferase domain-containing protein [Niabella sp.]